MHNKSTIHISIIVTNYNSEITIKACLESIFMQNYPIDEILIIDNNSSDNSLKVVDQFKKSNKKINIKVFKQKSNLGLIPSYILGIKKSKYNHIVMMHSDGRLPTLKELKNLIIPFLKDNKIVGTYPTILHPEKVWEKYNFWQKLHFSRVVGSKEKGLSGKFDCYKKTAISNIYDLWQKRFINTDEAGGEDWDLYSLLKKEGRVIPTNAKVEHLHLSSNYTLLDYIKKRKHVAKSYGKLLRLYNFKMGLKGFFAFVTKPILAISSVLPMINILAITILIIFSFIYTKKMFLTKKTLFDPRIFLLPFLNIFLVYYESFWTIKTFIFIKKTI